MRPARGDVRGHIVSRKNDHGPRILVLAQALGHADRQAPRNEEGDRAGHPDDVRRESIVIVSQRGRSNRGWSIR